jgi:hypothetical protein
MSQAAIIFSFVIGIAENMAGQFRHCHSRQITILDAEGRGLRYKDLHAQNVGPRDTTEARRVSTLKRLLRDELKGCGPFLHDDPRNVRHFFH